MFGVCCEGTGKQVFYLTDEAESSGKGANSVVSYVDHYLQHFGLGESFASFHFDNCTGQNKNNIVLWYAAWRVITGQHKKIHYGTMVAGHTKFAPDWHFGIWKSKWRHCDAETIGDVASTVRLSSKSGHNIPHLTCDQDHPVQFSEWKKFLGQFFMPLKNITSYHHFTLNSSEPGVVVCKKSVLSPEERFSLLRKDILINPNDRPTVSNAKGLDHNRQWYLYDEIRQFCYSDSAKDLTCPKPVVIKGCNSLFNSSTKRKFTADD